HSRGHVIGNQSRHSDPEVHVKSVAQLPRNPLHNPFALIDVFARLVHKIRRSSLLIRRSLKTRNLSSGVEPMRNHVQHLRSRRIPPSEPMFPPSSPDAAKH